MLLKDIPKVQAGKFVSVNLAEVEETTKSLAQRASDLLGYTIMSNKIQGRDVNTESTGPLTDTLKSLDIEVLDTNLVLQYQMEELSRRTLEAIKNNLNSWCTGWLTAATWSHTRLSEYTQPIPEFVVNKAIQIKENLPEVQFQIQHLSDPKDDPFLIAYLGKEIYYIEAWDEPRFEAL